jgi:MFS superfamily sulfate permease-like transporter
MQLEKQNEDFGRFSVRDILASIVVFLVALPLCMGVAIASGAPVATGLITGIVGGVIVGIMAGKSAPSQRSGSRADGGRL